MGLTSSKNQSVNYKDLYEPIPIYSPMTRFHALSVIMADGGLLKTTEDEYLYSKKYMEEKGLNNA
jgi:hypothetical protein